MRSRVAENENGLAKQLLFFIYVCPDLGREHSVIFIFSSHRILYLIDFVFVADKRVKRH